MTTDPLAFFRSAIEKQIALEPFNPAKRAGRFTERDVDHHTIGDLIRAILAVGDEDDARRFFDSYVAFIRKRWPDQDAPDAARKNIGWCFGEGMAAERRAMWIQVCDASHPFFGQDVTTPEQAFALGVARGTKARKEQL